MSGYEGNPDNYPAAITLLSDGTPPTAMDLNAPLEALADRTAYLDAHLTRNSHFVEFLADGDFVVGSSVTQIIVAGCGGGGSGGAGGSSAGLSRNTPRDTPGGGGGGGAPLTHHVIQVVPGETLHVAIGQGGQAGVPGYAAGQASRISRGGVDIAIFPGGGEGGSAVIEAAPDQYRLYTAGGSPRPFFFSPAARKPIGVAAPVLLPDAAGRPEPVYYRPAPPGLGEGGYGHTEASGTSAGYVGNGGAGPTGYAGGLSGGPRGADDGPALSVGSGGGSLFRGGGSGGGGGGGPYGQGGAGGAGGAAISAATIGANGVAGQNAAPNSGAGGGGGGAGGQGNDPATPDYPRGAAGNGGNGGSGRLVIYYEPAKDDV